MVNGSLLVGLLEWKAVKVPLVIHAALEKNQIDESMAGGWRDVLQELGIKADPDNPLLKKPPFRVHAMFPLAYATSRAHRAVSC